MGLETATYLGSLVATNPTGTDPKSQGDDHIRLVKSALLNTFPGFAGAVLLTGTEAQGATVNDYTVTVTPAPAAYVAGNVVLCKAVHANTSAATLQINALGSKNLLGVDGNALSAGDIESGSVVLAYYDGTNFLLLSGNDRVARDGDTMAGAHDFTGATLTVATQAAGDNSTKAASTAYVDTTFAPLASPALTGTPTAPTPANGDNSTKLATTAYVDAGDAVVSGTVTALTSYVNSTFAPIISPALTGTPTAPTPALGSNDSTICTTAFAVQQAFLAALPAQAGNAYKVVTTDGTTARWDYIPTHFQFLTNV